METDDLLNLLETAPETESSKHPVDEFIEKFKIQAGDHSIPPTKLYDLYLETTVLPIEKTPFTKALMNRLGHLRAGNRQYQLNISLDFINTACGVKEKKKTKPSRPPCYFQDYKKFVNRAELKSGKQAILVSDLYLVYKNYQECVKGSGKRMKLDNFIECTNLYFGIQKASKGIFVRINENFKKEFKDEKGIEQEENTPQQEQVSSIRSISELKDSM